MLPIALLSILLACVYAVALLAIRAHWRRGTWPVADAGAQIAAEQPYLSVLVAARDEAGSIGACCRAVLGQSYPAGQFELIVVDDHSADATAAVVMQLADSRVHLLHLADFPAYGTGKKAALQLGIDHSLGAYIVTTDADCLPHTEWLTTLAGGFAQGYGMLLGPVAIAPGNTFLTAWQGLDVAGTMLLTGATAAWGMPLLANGANFAYAKDWYRALGGHQGHHDKASGDDIFLLQKAALDAPHRIGFLPQAAAVVVTQPADSWRALFWQRLRWAAKTGAYRDARLVLFQAGVYTLCAALLLLAGAAILHPAAYATWAAAAWGIKLLADGVYLHDACYRLGQPAWLLWLLPAQVLHVVYIVVVGTLALLPVRFVWKGRRVR